jgi:hypothetical protein
LRKKVKTKRMVDVGVRERAPTVPGDKELGKPKTAPKKPRSRSRKGKLPPAGGASIKDSNRFTADWGGFGQ